MSSEQGETRGRAKAIPAAQWSAALALFRKGRTPYAIAQELGLNFRTVQKAWRDGLTVRLPGGGYEDKPAIEKVMTAEQSGARAVLATVDGTLRDVPASIPAPASHVAPAEAAPTPAAPPVDPVAVAKAVAAGRMPPALSTSLAAADATAALAAELQLVRVSRGNVSGLVAATSNVLAGAVRLSLKLQTAMAALVVKSDAESVTEAVRLMGAVTLMAKLSNDAVGHVLKAERLLAGDPRLQASPTGAPADAYDATPEEAEAELARLAPFVAKYGHLRVINGGDTQAPPAPATEDAAKGTGTSS